MNLQESVWEIQYRIIMRTILQEKQKIHYNITIWFTNLFLWPQAMEDSRSKSSSGQGMGEIGENSGVEPDESQK